MLPCNPLLALGELWVTGEAELVIRVVVPCQVRQDSSALHDGQLAIVVIDKDWDPAVRPQIREPLLFLDILHDGDALEGVVGLAVRFFQLLQYD